MGGKMQVVYWYWIIISLISALIAAIIFAGDLYFKSKEISVKEKIVYVKKPIEASTIEEMLLAFGVTSSWEETFGSNIKADCFQTELVNGDSLFTYCKLRKPLIK